MAAGVVIVTGGALLFLLPGLRRGEGLDQTLKRLMSNEQTEQVEADFTKLQIPERQAAFFSLKAEKEDKYGLTPGGSLVLTAREDVNLDLVNKNLESTVPMSVAAVSGREFRLTPRQNLAPDQELKVRLAVRGAAWSGGNIDRDYGWAFQAAGKFRVTGGIPGNNKKNVPVNTGIEIAFSQDDYQDPALLLSVDPPIKYRLERHAETLAIVPLVPLEKKTIYTVSLKKGLNLASRSDPIDQDYSFSFQTTGDDVAQPGPRLWVQDDFVQVGANEAPALRVFTSNWNGDTKAKAEIYKFDSRDQFLTSRKNNDGAYGEWYSYFPENNPVDTSGMPKVGEAQLALIEKENLAYVQLPEGLANGLYLIKLWMDGGKQLQEVWLQSTDLSGYLSLGRRQTLVWANDRSTGQPAAATVRIVGQGGSYVTSDAGVAVFSTPDVLFSNKPGYVELTTEGQAVILPVRSLNNSTGPNTESADDWWSLVYRERTFYKPSDTIYFWGVVKNRDSGAAPGNLRASLVRGYDSENNVIGEKSVEVAGDGTYTGRLEFKDLPAGWYSLVIKLPSGTVLVTDGLEVKEYEKPEIKMEVGGDKTAMFAGEKANFVARSSFFDGTPTRDMKMHVYEDKAGAGADMTTDGKGEIKYTLQSQYTGNFADYPRYESVTVNPALAVTGKIEGYGSVYVFGSRLIVGAETTQEGKTAKVKIKVNKVDLTRFGKEGSGDVRGEAKANEPVTVTVTKSWYERKEIGTYYDFVEKTTRPNYEYIRHEEKAAEAKVTTNNAGEADYQLEMEAERSYQITARVTDQDNHPAQAGTFAYYWENQTAYEGNQATRLQISLDKTENYYSLDEAVKVKVTREGREVKLGEGDRILYIVASQGRQDFFVETTPSLTFDLARKHIPNAYVGAVVLLGKNYQPVSAPCEWDWACYYPYDGFFFEAAEIRYKKQDSQMTVVVEPENPKYKPGKAATIKVRVTKDNQGVAGTEVNLAVVDEALAAIGGVIKPDTLNKLYRPLSSMVYYTYFTHKPLEPNSGGAEKGGGGGDYREVFKDTAAFATARTDAEGVALFSFTLPDNLTTWLVYAQAVSDNLWAGQGEGKVITTQEFFVTSNFPKKYLAADRPIVSANAFGSALRGTETVNYTATVWAGEKEKEKRQASGKVFADTGMTIPILAAGEYSLGLTGKSGAYEDGVKYPFEVAESTWEFEQSRRYSLGAGEKLDNLALGSTLTDRPVTVVISDAGKGRYYWELKRYCWENSNRLEKRIAKVRAGQVVQAEFADSSCSVEVADKQAFQGEDGGLAQVVWGGSNVETSVWAVHTDPEGWDREKLETYFSAKADEDQGGNVQKIYGWWGVTELGGPGLRQLKLLARAGGSFEEKVLTGLALAFAGEKEEAREMYYDILADYAYSSKPYIRIQRDGANPGDVNRVVKDTAWTLLLGAEVEPQYNAGMDMYLEQNAYAATDVVLDLARMAFIKEEMAKAGPGDTTVTVSTPIKEVTKTLSRGSAATVSLTAAEASKTKMAAGSGRAEVTANYYVGAQAAGSLKTDDRLKLTRTIQKAAGSGDIKAGDVVEVRLDYDFGGDAPRGGYSIADYLPAGLVYLENPGAYGLKTKSWISQVDNAVTTYVYNSPWWPDRTVVYYARAASGGTYVAEPAVMQARIDLEVFTLAGSQTVKIGVGP